MSENISHSLGGFRGAFESEYGRKPTEQEIWNAAIRSWRDLTQQKSSAAKEREGVIADLLMYAGDNGYSHIDYADTMRHAAALLSAPTLPVELTESELMKCIAQAGCFGTVKLSYESGPYYLDRPTLNATKLARAILAAARTQPELVPMTDDQIQGIYIRTYNIGHHGRNFENAFARAIEAAHGITNKAKEPQS